MAGKSFYLLKSSHSGFFFSICIIRTAKIVRILHKWYFTKYLFSVDVKDLNPWRKLELWQRSLSCEQSAGLFCIYWVLQALVQELCPVHLCNMDLSFVTVVWCLSASPALIFCHISSARTHSPPCFLSGLVLYSWRTCHWWGRSLLSSFYCRFGEGVDGCSPHSTSSATIRHRSLIHLLLTLHSHQRKFCPWVYTRASPVGFSGQQLKAKPGPYISENYNPVLPAFLPTYLLVALASMSLRVSIDSKENA